jgi:hypothetical protein
MKPSQLAGQLRRIAGAIDSSRNPDRGLVIKDIRRVLLAMDPEDQGQSNGNTAGPIDWMKNKKKKYDDNKKLDNDADALHEKTLQAQNPDTSPEILAKLADDDSAEVRKELARNKKAPSEIKAKLASVLHMKPSQLASQLRRIAAAIDRSKNPDRRLVYREIRRALASMNQISSLHKQGDPASNGWDFSVTFDPSTSTDIEKVFLISGTYMGQTISVQVKCAIENGVFAGYNEYIIDQGTFDFSQDDQATEIIMDACQADLGSI